VELVSDVSQTDSIFIIKASCDECHVCLPEDLGLEVPGEYCILCEWSRVYIEKIGCAIQKRQSIE
jgi:hypothetical protein